MNTTTTASNTITKELAAQFLTLSRYQKEAHKTHVLSLNIIIKNAREKEAVNLLFYK